MPVTGMSFFYEEEKVKILRQAAKDDDNRTPSSYIQNVLQEHIDSMEMVTAKVTPKVLKKTIKKRRKNRD